MLKGLKDGTVASGSPVKSEVDGGNLEVKSEQTSEVDGEKLGEEDEDQDCEKSKSKKGGVSL